MKFFLIGFMGAGKSTVGKYAARHSYLHFVDLDTWIEESSGSSIPEIFAEKGEDGFREVEREALQTVTSWEGDWLISCGGGTPCFFDNMDFMNAQGITIFMDLSAGRLTDRLKGAKEQRPLIRELGGDLQIHIHKMLMQRAPWYQQAQHIVPEEKANKKGIRDLIIQVRTDQGWMPPEQ